MSAPLIISVPPADAIFFDKTGTDFTSEEVRAAIIEAKQNNGTNLDRILCDQNFNAIFDQNGNILWGA